MTRTLPHCTLAKLAGGVRRRPARRLDEIAQLQHHLEHPDKRGLLRPLARQGHHAGQVQVVGVVNRVPASGGHGRQHHTGHHPSHLHGDTGALLPAIVPLHRRRRHHSGARLPPGLEHLHVEVELVLEGQDLGAQVPADGPDAVQEHVQDHPRRGVAALGEVGEDLGGILQSVLPAAT